MAQQPDTLVIYEYINVTDTVWVEEESTPRDTNQLQVLFPIENQSIITHYNNATATLLENPILLKNQNEMQYMKKNRFFTFLLLGIPAFTFAQNHFTLKAGGSLMWLQHHAETITNTPWVEGHGGIDYSHKIGHSDFNWSVGLSAGYAKINTGYFQKKEVNASLTEFEYDYAVLKTDILLRELNSGAFTAPYIEISLPMKIGYQLNRLRPYTGIEYRYSNFLNGDFTKYNNYTLNTDYFHDLGLILGFDCYFSRHWGISLEGIQSLTSKSNNSNNGMFPSLGQSEYYFKNLKMNANLIYSF